MSSSCGLKNSGCPDDGDNGSAVVVAVAEDLPSHMYRFNFVDGVTGLWTTTPAASAAGRRGTAASGYGNITCPVGGMVVFFYPMGESSVVQAASEEDWQSCNNLENATMLSPPSLPDERGSSSFSHLSYYHRCVEPGAIDYLTSSIPGQCEGNQKVIVHTSDSDYAQNQTTGEWDLHVESLTRVLTLLGYRETTTPQQEGRGQEEETVFVMDRGYQTEELANTTAGLIWCALDHCPEFALDWDPTAELSDCESIVFTLLGFVHRKRPIPQWNRSEDYYHQAIERGGSNECAARSYLTQLYMNKGDFVNATSHVASLCGYCSHEGGVISQTRSEYERLGITEFDFDLFCEGTAPTTFSGASRWDVFNGRDVVTRNCLLCMVLVITLIAGKR